jgi:hypothetical protein
MCQKVLTHVSGATAVMLEMTRGFSLEEFSLQWNIQTKTYSRNMTTWENSSEMRSGKRK